MSMRSRWRAVLASGSDVGRAFRDALFPLRCLQCRQALLSAAAPDGSLLPEVSQRLLPYFCRQCLQGVMPLESPICPHCGVMFKGRAGDDHLCGRCLERPPPFRKARSAFVYDRSLVDIIHWFKYRGKAQLARPLGILMLQTFARHWAQEPVDLIVPVPLHRRRLRQRGFNQAAFLVAEWRKHPLGRDVPVTGDTLVRARPTRSQTGLGLEARESNIRHAFAVRQPETVSGRHLLLVDDVITTGATAGECARLLLAAGARRVDVLALARVI